MPSRTINAIPETRPEDTLRFLKSWFQGGQDDWLISIAQIQAGTKMLRPTIIELGKYREAIEQYGIDELTYDSRGSHNLYHGVNWLSEVPPRGKRGGKKNVKAVPGVALDLDVKDECFKDAPHIHSVLDALAIPTSIRVETGTGGVQPYFRTDRILEGHDAQRLANMLWAYVREVSGVSVDDVSSPDHLFRTPGGIRYPKEAGEETTLVRLVQDDGPVVPVSLIENVCQDAWMRVAAKRRETSSTIRMGEIDASFLAAELTGWNLLYAMAQVQGKFNEETTWDQILLPYGWSNLGYDGEGRTIWARPGGGRRKAAATDYLGGHVMTLFSDSVETGLSHLKDAGISLTKYRVWVQLAWGGREADFVRAYLEQNHGSNA